jgi:DNA-binding MarR family transcriptional regulator
MYAGRLGAASNLSPGATTAAIDRLERAGYVRRARPGTDRRAVLIEMTPLADERLREVYGPVGRAGLAYLGRFTDAELRFLRDFLVDGYHLQVEHARRLRVSSVPGEGQLEE